jgi:hypothetical protein
MREHGYIGHEPNTSPSSTSAGGMWSRMRVMELARRSLWPLNNTFYLPDILSRLQYTRTAQANRFPANNIDNDTTSTPAGTYPGSNAFASGVLLPDGRVFCVPNSSTSARIYDPVANSVSTPAGTYPGNIAFAGGVLLPDGRVFCVPRNSDSARICSGDFSSAGFNFDPTTLRSAYLNKY